MGMTVVIITGGIDLSVGSVMGLVAIVAGLFLTWHYPWYVAFAMGMLAGLGTDEINRRFSAADRHLRESGVFYRVYEDPRDLLRHLDEVGVR